MKEFIYPRRLAMASPLLPPILPPSTTSNPTRSFSTSLPRAFPVSCKLAVSFASNKKIVRFPALDRRASSHNRLRFVRKLTGLLLSKPLHFLPLRVLQRCLPYLRPSRPLLQMIRRYPAVFHFVRTPSSRLAVSLTPEALSFALDESALRSRIASTLASKIQKLLLLSPHRRLLLSKIAHLAPDLGLPRDFRSSLLPRYPDRFRIVLSSYGPALELLSFDPSLALPLPLPSAGPCSPPPIIGRPARFTRVRLRKGLNLKRRDAVYLERFAGLREVNPYLEVEVEEGMEERRACAVVREVLAATVERRTLVDHLTHFRKDFGLPNKLRAMLVRHPEMFYVSIKGIRDSVFLVEGYSENGKLVEEDELVAARRRLTELVREGKRMRRDRKRGIRPDGDGEDYSSEDDDDDDDGEDWGLVGEDDFGGDLENLFENDVSENWEDWNGLGQGELELMEEVGEFWSMKDDGLKGVDVW